MDQPFREQNAEKTRILVAPLDWGLGHATRCIPLITELIKDNCEVIIASDGAQESLLKKEFSELQFIKLEGYKARYSKSSFGMLWQMLIQYPKFTRIIAKENKWLQTVIKDYNIDAVISDNRYGLNNSSIPCIFITHQLLIKSPLGKLTEMILQKGNYRYINKFSECWIPDTKSDSLAGELSHPQKKPSIPLSFIGILSRFDKAGADEIKKHLLILISGPEPQRTIFENIIVQQVSHYNGTATIVRGLPDSTTLIPSTNMIRFYNHLPAEELNEEMEKAAYVISRSGYSTIMDIAALQKKSILIPTPGQTEQEYLAGFLFKKRFALTCSQKQFSLATILTEAEKFDYHLPEVKNNLLEETVKQFVTSLRK